MEPSDAVAAIMAPWLTAVDQLEQAYATPDAAENADLALRLRQPIARLRTLLQALARGEEAIPPEVAASPFDTHADPAKHIDQLLRHPRLPAKARGTRRLSAAALRQQRELLLHLSLWRLLSELQEQAMQQGWTEPPFAELQRRLAATATAVPPGISPTLQYAASAAASSLFNAVLPAVLRALAQRYPKALGFSALAELAPFDASAVGAARHGSAWTAAAAGVYLDWLDRRSAGNVANAVRQLWAPATSSVRFRAPSDLKALPSRERAIHLDLWTGLVHAQLLAHDAKRFAAAAAGQVWHRVPVDMHDLGGGPRPGKPGKPGEMALSLVRGLGVEMIYEVAFIDAAMGALRQPPQPKPAMAATDAPTLKLTIVLDLPTPPPGHELTMELALQWLAPDTKRRLPSLDKSLPEPVRLSAEESKVYAAWREQCAPSAAAAVALSPASMDWRADAPATALDDEASLPWHELGHALGHARLWAVAGATAQWLDFALAVRSGGRWQMLPVCLHDEVHDGELRSWLLIEAEDALPGIELEALRAAFLDRDSCIWCTHHDGLGAFVLCAVDLDRTGIRAARTPHHEPA